MIIKKTDIATIFKSDESTVEIFFEDFSKNYTTFKHENIIIDFSETKGVKKESILLFLQHIKKHVKNGMSFVIVVNDINIDELPEELNTAPTVQEALDIIEMENIERDLGI
jgi:hypothetical protein